MSITRDSAMERQSATLLTTIILIGANVAPLIGVLFFDWRVFDIMVLFWMENVVVGLLNVIKMATLLFLRGRLETIFLIPFFCVHYGMFTMVHGIFVMALFGPKSADGSPVFDDAGFDPFENPLALFEPLDHAVIWPLLGLFLSHMISYFVHFIGRGEYKKTNGGELMGKPYGRVVVLHLTILIGGFIAMATGENMYALAFLVLLKIGIDIASHRREHAAGDKDGGSRQKSMASALGAAFSSDLGPKSAFPVPDLNSGYEIKAAAPHPKFASMPVWARGLVKTMGGMMRLDVEGGKAGSMTRKMMRDMTARGKSLPDDFARRVVRVRLNQGTTLRILLDDGTVVDFDYFENTLRVYGSGANTPENLRAILGFAGAIQGFDKGVRVRSSQVTVENDVRDAVKRSDLLLLND